jgi:hypothetical protein
MREIRIETPDDVDSAIGQLEAGALTFREMRALGASLQMQIPQVTSRSDLAAVLIDRLRNGVLPETGATSSPESAPKPGADGAQPQAFLPGVDSELLLDEDLDVVAVFRPGDERPALSRRLGGLRGTRAMQVVRDVRQLAESEGYVIRRQLRRIAGTDYGL